MLDLNDFQYFVEVATRGGFSAASRALQRPTSTISYRIQQLERELGLALLVRSSRTVVMTDAGREFYGYALSIIEQAREAEGEARRRLQEPIGTLHFTVAMSLAQFAMPDMLTGFAAEHPHVKLIQHVGNELVELIAGRYDVAIHAHSEALPDSQLVQHPLVPAVPWHLFASPAYLEESGPVAAPGDVDPSQTLFVQGGATEPMWRLRSQQDRARIVELNLRPRLVGTCMLTLKHAAEAGLGIVALPAYVCRAEVQSGRLVRVLPDWIAAESMITALMPHRRGMAAATRAFIDHIAAAFPAAVADIVGPAPTQRTGREAKTMESV